MAAYSSSSLMTALGPRLVRAALGYRRRVEERLDAAGFSDRRFPDDLILWLCLSEEGVTISQIGRQLGVTRQSASKLITGLSERGYISVEKSSGDAREKIVRPTQRARERLAVAEQARHDIDQDLRARLGDQALAALDVLLEELAGSGPVDVAEILRERHVRFAYLGANDR